MHPETHPTLAVFLAAMRPEPDAVGRALERHRRAIDWTWLLERATAHKVVALLADRLVHVGGEIAAPPAAQERLQEATTAAVACNAKALRDLAGVDACLGEAGISYLLVKGPILAHRIYDTPAQRAFFDLDVVIREEDVDTAQDALEGIGYRLWGGERYLGFEPTAADDLARAMRVMRSSRKRFEHELSLITDDWSLMPVDLHWSLMPRGRIRRASAKQLWENATAVSVGGIDVHVLDPEATLLHLAMHAWSNRPWNFALLHLCDVAWALHRLPIDPQRLLDLADRWGGRGDLSRSLYAVVHVLGVDIPAALGPVSASARFRRLSTPEKLVEHATRAAVNRGRRLGQELEWGLAMGSLRSTAVLLVAKYSALLRYYARPGS